MDKHDLRVSWKMDIAIILLLPWFPLNSSLNQIKCWSFFLHVLKCNSDVESKRREALERPQDNRTAIPDMGCYDTWRWCTAQGDISAQCKQLSTVSCLPWMLDWAETSVGWIIHFCVCLLMAIYRWITLLFFWLCLWAISYRVNSTFYFSLRVSLSVITIQ